MATQSVFSTDNSTFGNININKIVQTVQSKTPEQAIKYPEIVWNVPTRNNNFIGREGPEDVLTYLHEELIDTSLPRPNLTVIEGPTGIGKTSAVTEFIWKYATDKQFAGVAWFDQWGTYGTEIFEMFCEKANIPEKETFHSPTYVPSKRVSLWFENNPNWLVIFDKVETLENLHVPTKGAFVIVTTSFKLNWDENVPVFFLKGFTQEESNGLFKRVTGGTNFFSLQLDTPGEILIMSSLVKKFNWTEEKCNTGIDVNKKKINDLDFCELLKSEPDLKNLFTFLQYFAFINQPNICSNVFLELIAENRTILRQLKSCGFIECDSEKNVVCIQGTIQCIMYRYMLENFDNFKSILLGLVEKAKELKKKLDSNTKIPMEKRKLYSWRRLGEGIYKMIFHEWDTGSDSRFNDDDIKKVLLHCMDIQGGFTMGHVRKLKK